MEIKVRTKCTVCDGTGKNNLDYLEAVLQAEREPQAGVLLPGQLGPKPIDVRARELMQCGHCTDGWNEAWLPIAEVASEINRFDGA